MTWMVKGPKPNKDGTPHDSMYVKGWQDGCHTGISAVSNAWYKFYYQFRQDWELAQNQVYYKGWKDSFNYCQRYLYQWQSRIGF